MKLDWPKIWSEFDKWFSKTALWGGGDKRKRTAIQRIVQKELQQTRCPYCGHVPDDCKGM